MDKAILVIHVVVSAFLVGIILLQRSNADGGAAFGGGSQQTLFGTSGSAPLLTRVTVALTAIWFITSLTLAYFNRHMSDDTVIIPTAETVEVNPAQDFPKVTVNPVADDIPSAPESENNNSDIPVPQE